MKKLGWLVAASTSALVLVACGGKTDGTLPGDDGGTTKDAAPSPDAAPPHPTPAPDCPVAQPQDGSACSKSGVQCEYGGDPRWTCNWIATCEQGRWSVTTTNDAWCPTPSQNPTECPSTFGSVQQGGSCQTADLPCQYPEGWCTCTYGWGPPLQDGGTPDGFWACSTGPAAGCPASRPRLGTSCTTPDLECDYGTCGQPSGLAVSCDAQTLTWTEGFGAVCGGASN